MTDQEKKEVLTETLFSVICTCGRAHALRIGIDALVYWCRSELRELEHGDAVLEREEIW